MSRLANHRPTSSVRNQLRKTRYGAIHEHNPAGSKRLRKMFKAKHGERGTAKEAAAWFAIPNPKEPRFRQGENQNRIGLTLLAEQLAKRS